MALIAQGMLLFFCYRIDGFCTWSVLPYNWHLFGSTGRLPPEVGPQEYLPFLVVLVDAQSDRIVTKRGLSIPPRFGRTLHQQANIAFGITQLHFLLQQMHETFPTPDDLVRSCQTYCRIEASSNQMSHFN